MTKPVLAIFGGTLDTGLARCWVQAGIAWCAQVIVLAEAVGARGFHAGIRIAGLNDAS